MITQIKNILTQSIATKEALLKDEELMTKVAKAIEMISHAFSNGHKVLFCGNGGSAADAQHLAAEFSGRFYKDRKPLPAEALHCNTSYLTAVANDYGYEFVYSRMVQGLMNKGDILVGLSTSGNSINIINAFETANALGAYTIGLTGMGGGKMATLSNVLLAMPSTDTPRIQECHITLGHIICQMVEETLFNG